MASWLSATRYRQVCFLSPSGHAHRQPCSVKPVKNKTYTPFFNENTYLCCRYIPTIMKKVALISGITGQDGSYLAEFLINKGYEVHGILRRSSSFNTGRIEHLYLDEWVRDMKRSRLVNLHYGDMTDSSSLIRIIQTVQPDEIYNLAAQSHVKVSLTCPNTRPKP